MKKITAFVLLLLMSLMLFSCGKKDENRTEPESPAETETENPDSGTFRVGFAREICMPDTEVPLRGYGNSKFRISDGFMDYLSISCIALTDVNEQSMLLFTVDLCGSKWAPEFREKVVAEFGIPEEYVMVTCTHTHSGPAYDLKSDGRIGQYMEKVHTVGLTVAREALEDRAPAEMYWGTADLKGYNFVRHYVMSDGSVSGDNFGTTKGLTFVGYPAEENTVMSIVKFEREDQKDVYLTNWRAHAHITGGKDKTNISADFPFVFRNYVEKELDCYVGYYQGDAGNSNPCTKIAEDGEPNVTLSGTDRNYKVYGERIGALVVEAVNAGMEKMGDGAVTIAAEKYNFVGDVNHSEDYLAPVAKLVNAEWRDSGDSGKAMALAKDSGIVSVYHAGGILEKQTMPLTTDEDVYVARIGELGLTFAPNEQFVENGDFIRENSPFKYQIVMCYSNYTNGYIPSQAGYDYHCYEMCTGKFAPGTGEILASKFVELLGGLKEK